MRSIKILHAADIHLDAPFRFLGIRGEAQRLQVRRTLERICRIAVDDTYDLLLIAGDLFDSNSVSDRTCSWLSACLEAVGMPVCICPGTHDCLDSASVYRRKSLAWPENVFVFTAPSETSCPLPALDLIVHARANCSPRSSESPLRGIRRRGDARWEVAMAHGSIVIPGKTEDADTPIKPEEIESSTLDYIALGHWHSWGDYSTGSVKAVYPGSPERMDFSGGPGSVASISLTEQGVFVQRREVGLRKMSERRIAVTGMNESEEIRREIAAVADPELALRVVLEGLCEFALQADIAALETELRDRFFFLQIDDRSHPSIAHLPEGLFPENLVIGKYVRRMAERIEAAGGDDETVRTLEDALRLGVALLQGRQAL